MLSKSIRYTIGAEASALPDHLSEYSGRSLINIRIFFFDQFWYYCYKSFLPDALEKKDYEMKREGKITRKKHCYCLLMYEDFCRITNWVKEPFVVP